MSSTPPVAVEKSENAQATTAPSSEQSNNNAPALPRVSIFNLPQGITSKDDLLTLCKTYGQVVDAEFYGPKPNKQAFGFVTFKTREDAEFAIYRLDKSNLGGKVPVKAMMAQERPKREGFVPGQKKPKVKKPITPLTVLTPKNLASNVQQQDGPLNGKAGWDLNKQQQVQTQQQNNKGPRNNQKNQGNGGQPQGQQGGAQKQNNQQAKGKAPAAGNNAPVQNAQQTQALVQNQAQNQGQNQGQPGQGKKKRGGKGPNGQQQQGQPAQNQAQGRQNQGQAPVQGQVNQANTTVAAPQQAQNQPNQNQSQQGVAQNQPNQTQQGAKPKRNKKKKNPETQIRYRVNVVDPKTNLSLHVIELNQGQYDKFILPLVTKH